MKALDIFVRICATALDTRLGHQARESAIGLIRLRRFSPDRLGDDGAGKAEQLREAMLLWWDGRAARDNRIIIDQLLAEIAALPDYQPPAPTGFWWQKENA